MQYELDEHELSTELPGNDEEDEDEEDEDDQDDGLEGEIVERRSIVV